MRSARRRCWPTASTDLASSALGQNLLVAFMPWNATTRGFDLISDAWSEEDRFTTIHIERADLRRARTPSWALRNHRHIPNVGDSALAKLDEAGIAFIGAEWRRDILVGKSRRRARPN